MHHYDAEIDRLAEIIFGYTRERLRLEPVPLDCGVPAEQLVQRVGDLIRPEGNDPATVMRLFAEVLAPAVISIDSPRYLSYIPAAPTKAALLFDMVVSCSSMAGISWEESAGAVHAENQALRFIADLAGLPSGAGGCFVSGGSAANLSALVVARDTVTATRGGATGRRRVALSAETHSSVWNTLRILDCDPLVVPTEHERLTGPGIAAALGADGDPSSVFAVVATAGTTNAGVIDDLSGMAEVCRRYGLWFHVDAAYGGAALLAPSVRDRFTGIEHADSLVVDPHKWLFAPFDCAALLYREPGLAREVHTQRASYLEPMRARPDEWNPSDYAYHLSRRARGLPLWFSLAVHGSDAYRDAIESAIATARATAERIRLEPHLELAREPELSIVVFRRLGWGDADYRRWSEELLASQVAFVQPSSFRGEPVARLAFLHPGTTPEIVGEVLDAMR